MGYSHFPMTKKPRKSSDDITNRMLLEHMQAGMASLDTGLRGELKRVEKSLRSEIKRLDEKIDSLTARTKQCENNDEKTHLALQRLYEKRVEITEKVEDHEKRIVTIEKEMATTT